MLCLLQDQELSVGDLQAVLKTSNANISQHLTILRNQGIVKSRKDANFIYNRISDNRVVQLVDTLQDLFC
ncbi:MAG: helix-turn-helix transcriptional regulator [Deltaproteobacteria bacterium]|nr:helix-turn-helix transcriptional regulator [Deltaproteobacteria bacterium]